MAIVLFEEEWSVEHRIPPRKGGMLAALPKYLICVEHGIASDSSPKYVTPAIIGAKQEGVSLFNVPKTLELPQDRLHKGRRR